MAKTNNYYLNLIENYPLLTAEEEKALATKAFSGDKSAQKKLVESNLRFVVSIANQYKNSFDYEDLISEGNAGLVHAAEKFDPESGTRFLTYAVWWIRAYIQKAIRETSTGVKFPANKYKEMMKDKWKIASLNSQVKNEEGDETDLLNLLQDERFGNVNDEVWKMESSSLLTQMIGKLKERDRTVLIKRYGLDGNEPLSLGQIGEQMGYSKERIRQIENKALLDLKESLLDMGFGKECLAA